MENKKATTDAPELSAAFYNLKYTVLLTREGPVQTSMLILAHLEASE